jgi:hypothetical protein
MRTLRIVVQTFSGYYRVERGRVSGLVGNPFLDQVEGLSEQNLLDMIQAILR